MIFQDGVLSYDDTWMSYEMTFLCNKTWVRGQYIRVLPSGIKCGVILPAIERKLFDLCQKKTKKNCGAIDERLMCRLRSQHKTNCTATTTLTSWLASRQWPHEVNPITVDCLSSNLRLTVHWQVCRLFNCRLVTDLDNILLCCIAICWKLSGLISSFMQSYFVASALWIKQIKHCITFRAPVSG